MKDLTQKISDILDTEERKRPEGFPDRHEQAAEAILKLFREEMVGLAKEVERIERITKCACPGLICQAHNSSIRKSDAISIIRSLSASLK